MYWVRDQQTADFFLNMTTFNNFFVYGVCVMQKYGMYFLNKINLYTCIKIKVKMFEKHFQNRLGIYDVKETLPNTLQAFMIKKINI